MFLIDTGVWIDWLHGREAPHTTRLDALLVGGKAWLAPVIVQELMQGARNEEELRRLREEFLEQPQLFPNGDTYATAGELYARLRWRGVTIRSPHDCLISALAVEHGATLLTLDRDFEAIAAIEPRLALWRG